MSPALKVVMVPVEYWECEEPTHRHKTKSVAEACIAKARAARSSPHIKWTDDWLAELLAKYRGGVRKAELARQYSVSSSHISQRIKFAERREAETLRGEEFAGLTVRTRNCLLTEDIRSREHLERLMRESPDSLMKLPNFGRKSLREIRKWLDDGAKR